jgi:class 3 adenylate cyclase
MDVGAWLRGLGLGQYQSTFRENEIESDVLSELTESDLEKLGLPLGPRKRILKAIANLDGAERPAGATSLARPSRQDTAERRQLTVMFCDLAGSTALSARLDPEDMRQVIRAYQDACSGVIARYDGFVAKFMGDGILAYFGFPHAHEDDAERAVRAGLEIASLVGALQTRAKATRYASALPLASSWSATSWVVAQLRNRRSLAIRRISPRACRRWPSRTASWSQRPHAG